ncbi:hypothetical protein SDC9_113261 [bioreactor metagenome]|uniref:Uncharacterized protein n=1 Tax=bioreactor metagenome TaxID=1076179 RepID=A0A645BX94_9ZZZZ
MRQHIQPRVGRHLRRHAHHKLRVQHRRGRQQTVVYHRVFDILFMIRNDGETAHLGARAARSRDRSERTGRNSPLTVREKDDRLRRVDRRTAAEHDDVIWLELHDARHPRGDGLYIRVGLHIGENLIFRSGALKIIGDIGYLAA